MVFLADESSRRGDLRTPRSLHLRVARCGRKWAEARLWSRTVARGSRDRRARNARDLGLYAATPFDYQSELDEGAGRDDTGRSAARLCQDGHPVCRSGPRRG
ncbi:unnamed protein product [Amoebophrya sp. A25]|nr:unnamed protein product [Amoebophrya sp. A25]|eukprot:GSA25T00013396001.1